MKSLQEVARWGNILIYISQILQIFRSISVMMNSILLTESNHSNDRRNYAHLMNATTHHSTMFRNAVYFIPLKIPLKLLVAEHYVHRRTRLYYQSLFILHLQTSHNAFVWSKLLQKSRRTIQNSLRRDTSLQDW